MLKKKIGIEKKERSIEQKSFVEKRRGSPQEEEDDYEDLC